nr:hypothetical protein [Tanacetum cinerariifolium]
MANEGENHALVADGETSTEFALMANTKSKKDLAWTGLPEFVDNTVTDYSRPSPTVTSTSAEDSFTFEDVASPNPSKPFVKFVKPKDRQSKNKTKEQETPKKSQVKYAEQYRHSNKKPKGNQRNWNNLKSYQLGEGPTGHRPHGPLMDPRRPTMNGARPYKSFFNQAPSYETRPFLKSSTVRTQYRASWVPTVNRNNPPVSRKFSTGRRNCPTVTRKFPSASRKFITGSTKNHTADMGRKGKAVKPSACWTWNPLQKLSNKGTKDATGQEVKKDASSLRYIALPNWTHDAFLEFSLSSRNPNPTASSSNPPADQMETLTVESLIPTVSSPVPTACLNDSLEPSSKARLISKRVANQEETPSLDNILLLTNRFKDILGVTTSLDETIGVEADISNMETFISASPTPTLRIHKDHPKSQIIGHVDTPIQTRHKSKMVEEQSFIAT